MEKEFSVCHELIHFLNFQFMAREIQMQRDCLTTCCLPITSLLGQDKSFFILVVYVEYSTKIIKDLNIISLFPGQWWMWRTLSLSSSNWNFHNSLMWWGPFSLKSYYYILCYFNAIQRYIPEQILILSLKNEFWIFSK